MGRCAEETRLNTSFNPFKKFKPFKSLRRPVLGSEIYQVTWNKEGTDE
jgi:hypothetical protein